MVDIYLFIVVFFKIKIEMDFIKYGIIVFLCYLSNICLWFKI